MQKQLKVQCACGGTGFVPQVDDAGEDTEFVECGTHHPAYQPDPFTAEGAFEIVRRASIGLGRVSAND